MVNPDDFDNLPRTLDDLSRSIRDLPGRLSLTLREIVAGHSPGGGPERSSGGQGNEAEMARDWSNDNVPFARLWREMQQWTAGGMAFVRGMFGGGQAAAAGAAGGSGAAPGGNPEQPAPAGRVNEAKMARDWSNDNIPLMRLWRDMQEWTAGGLAWMRGLTFKSQVAPGKKRRKSRDEALWAPPPIKPVSKMMPTFAPGKLTRSGSSLFSGTQPLPRRPDAERGRMTDRLAGPAAADSDDDVFATGSGKQVTMTMQDFVEVMEEAIKEIRDALAPDTQKRHKDGVESQGHAAPVVVSQHQAGQMIHPAIPHPDPHHGRSDNSQTMRNIIGHFAKKILARGGK